MFSFDFLLSALSVSLIQYIIVTSGIYGIFVIIKGLMRDG